MLAKDEVVDDLGGKRRITMVLVMVGAEDGSQHLDYF